MKKLLSLVFVSAIAGALLLGSQTKGNAQQHQRQTQHATVMFSTYEGTGSTVQIYIHSAFGPGVPEFTGNAAEYITRLRDAGFEQQQAEWGYMFLR